MQAQLGSTTAGQPAAAPGRDAPAAARDGAAPRLFLVVVASAVILSTLTGSMVNVVLPVMRADFGASPAHIGWVVTGYSLAYVVGIPLYGQVSDRFGVRRVFVLGLLGFAAGALICALAPGLPVLVLGRIVQGLGGAAIPALATVAVATVLPVGHRGGALGVTASSVGIGGSVGPIVGGALGELLGWRALFVGALALALLLVPFAARLLPDGGADAEGRFDLVGGLLLGLAAGLCLFGITQAQAVGVGTPAAWGSFLVAAGSAAGFALRVRRAAHPFVSPALFANRAYLAALLVGFAAMVANMAALVLVPLLVVDVYRLPASAAGLLLTPGAVTLAVLSLVTGRLSDRVGVRPPIVAGLTLMALALLVLSTLAGSSPALVAVGVVGLGAGFACIQSPTNNAAANALDREVGGGLGLYAAAFFLGGGAGPALTGALRAAWQAAAAPALNPLVGGSAGAFSDTFLALLLPLLLALLATTGLRSSHAARRNAVAQRTTPGPA